MKDAVAEVDCFLVVSILAAEMLLLVAVEAAICLATGVSALP